MGRRQIPSAGCPKEFADHLFGMSVNDWYVGGRKYGIHFFSLSGLSIIDDLELWFPSIPSRESFFRPATADA